MQRQVPQPGEARDAAVQSSQRNLFAVGARVDVAGDGAERVDVAGDAAERDDVAGDGAERDVEPRERAARRQRRQHVRRRVGRAAREGAQLLQAASNLIQHACERSAGRIIATAHSAAGRHVSCRQ